MEAIASPHPSGASEIHLDVSLSRVASCSLNGTTTMVISYPLAAIARASAGSLSAPGEAT